MEDFIFTAAHTELMRYTRGLCVTAATDAKEDGSGQGWRGGTLGEDESRGILESGVFILVSLFYTSIRSLLHISSLLHTLGLFYTCIRSLLTLRLETAHDICEAFLDNRRRLKNIPIDPRSQPQGVLNLADYWLVRPDVGARQELLGGEMLEPAACLRRRRWAELSEEVVAGKVKAMVARLEAGHVQLKLDGVRNIWIVKPGHGSRGRGIKVFDDLEAIITFATSRKKSAIAQKYIENCFTLDKKKFDIRFWVLVTNWNPLTLWCYEPYFRLCTEDHSLDMEEQILKSALFHRDNISSKYQGTDFWECVFAEPQKSVPAPL